MTSILVLSAGLSSPSSTRMLADLLAGAAREEIQARGEDVEVRTVELRSFAHDLTDTLLSHFPNDRVAELMDQIRAADAIVVTTPIFNTAGSALLKLLIDAVDVDVWRGKPVLLGASAGTARHSLALEYAIRPMFVYLKAVIVPTAVFAASSDFGLASAAESGDAPLTDRARRAGRELASLIGVEDPAPEDPADPGSETAADGARSADASEEHEASAATGEFADFVPMGDLLHRR